MSSLLVGGGEQGLFAKKRLKVMGETNHRKVTNSGENVPSTVKKEGGNYAHK